MAAVGEIHGEAAVVEGLRLWLQQCLPRAGAGSGAQCVEVECALLLV